MEYSVRIKSTRHRPVWRSHFYLRRAGLQKDRFGNYAGTVSSKRKLLKLRAYCERKRLYFRIDNSYGSRGGSYRAIFFRTHRPAIGNRYFCAYCGKLLTEKNVTVDHLYPVGTAYKDPDMQKRLKKLHLSGINDPKNLVAACRTCNQKKGKKMGEWITKGRRGRHAAYWYLRWLLRVMIAAVLIWLVWRLCRIMLTGSVL